eukprot:symbB.v1.2.030814.t1/scaffold3513.1/size55048/4
MASPTRNAAAPHGWEWAFIPDVTDVARAQVVIADPYSWKRLTEHEEMTARLAAPCRLIDAPSAFFSCSYLHPEIAWNDCGPVICAYPKGTEGDNGPWFYSVMALQEDAAPATPPGQVADWTDSRMSVLVRMIPAPLVLGCCLSETSFGFNMAFTTLAGNYIGRATYSKHLDWGYPLTMQFITTKGEDVAEQQNLFSSTNQSVVIVLEGASGVLPPSTVLWRPWRESGNSESEGVQD